MCRKALYKLIKYRFPFNCKLNVKVMRAAEKYFINCTSALTDTGIQKLHLYMSIFHFKIECGKEENVYLKVTHVLKTHSFQTVS